MHNFLNAFSLHKNGPPLPAFTFFFALKNSLEKNFFEADLSCDRSYLLSNGRDQRANAGAMHMAAFTGMLLNFNI